jgi:hypothetical protein
MDPHRTHDPGRRLARAVGLALACTAVACGDAELSDMVPGGHIVTGELECWLTLEFKRLPEGIDPKDVKIRFVSEALETPAEFGWPFIARNDYELRKNVSFGPAMRRKFSTTAAGPPPLNEPLRVKFPLEAKRRVQMGFASTLWLHAELWWGGEKQDSVKRSIGHMYQREL